MSENNDAIFREVDDEVRQEEYKKFVDRYAWHLGIAAALFIAAVAAWQGWQYLQVKQSQDAGAVYYAALKKASSGKTDDALAALAVVRHPGFGQLASLESAGLLAAKGDTEKAVAAYDAFAAEPNNEPALASLAKIRAGYLLVDTQSPDQLLTRLGPFDKDDAQWHNEAREIFALSAYRVKDFPMAQRYFAAIETDAKAGAGLKQRAQLMLQMITPNLPAK